MGTTKLKISMSSAPQLQNVNIIPQTQLQPVQVQTYGGTKDYEKLFNKPQINGVDLSGDQSSEDLRIISENTVSGWAERKDYLPRRGEICVYTDYAAVEDDQGHMLSVPGIKIGDGNAYLADLPFAGDDLRYLILRELRQHAGNGDIHVTPQEKAFWNAKLNYDVSGEELILNRK